MNSIAKMRYLWLVSAPRIYFRVIFALLAVAGVAIEFVNQGSSDFASASILLVQLFAVSTGFTRFASRGYYDPILVSGGGRLAVALAHFVVSALPGALAWVVVGVAQAVAAKSLAVLALRPAGWAALLLVSTIPWALTLRLPPLSGGAIWLTLSAAFLVSGKGMELVAMMRQTPSSAEFGFLKGVGFGLAFPLFVPDVPWPSSVLCGLFGACAAALCLGGLFVARGQFPLVEEGS
jgi:hypothetical protein